MSDDRSDAGRLFDVVGPCVAKLAALATPEHVEPLGAPWSGA